MAQITEDRVEEFSNLFLSLSEKHQEQALLLLRSLAGTETAQADTGEQEPSA